MLAENCDADWYHENDPKNGKLRNVQHSEFLPTHFPEGLRTHRMTLQVKESSHTTQHSRAGVNQDILKTGSPTSSTLERLGQIAKTHNQRTTQNNQQQIRNTRHQRQKTAYDKR